MADTSGPGTKLPLGVGDIISSTFSIFGGNIVKLGILGFLGAFIGLVVNTGFMGYGVAVGLEEPDVTDMAALFLGIFGSIFVNIIVYGFVTAMLVLLAYDAKMERTAPLGSYISKAIPAILPIFVLSIVVAILGGLGMIALVLPGLWVFAVFYVMAPVVVIEKGGFGSLSRSAALTKEYRWPIVGLFVVVGIFSIILQTVTGFVIGLLAGALGTLGSVWIGGAIYSITTGIGYAIGGVAVALTYARLREIKEGIGVDQIASVFD